MAIRRVSSVWMQMLVPSVVVVAAVVTGLQADDCKGQCGYGTYCSSSVFSSSNYHCKCKEGYGGRRVVTGSNPRVYYCKKICNSNRTGCPLNTTCVFSRNSYLCDCSAGFSRSSTGQCSDNDECLREPNICGNNSVCSNTDGSYTCQCVEGYGQRNGEDLGCEDNDECLREPNICGNNSVCSNTDGSYICQCVEGYEQRNGEDFGCKDCSEESCKQDGNNTGEDFSTNIVIMGVVISAMILLQCSLAAVVVEKNIIATYKKRMANRLERQKARDDTIGQCVGRRSNDVTALPMPSEEHLG